MNDPERHIYNGKRTNMDHQKQREKGVQSIAQIQAEANNGIPNTFILNDKNIPHPLEFKLYMLV